MSFLMALVLGFGFCLIIEGMAYALFPRQFLAMWEAVRAVPPDTIRVLGLVSLAAGVAIVWAIM